jgi:hypothetical protein
MSGIKSLCHRGAPLAAAPALLLSSLLLAGPALAADDDLCVTTMSGDRHEATAVYRVHPCNGQTPAPGRRLLRPADFNPSQFECRVTYRDGSSEEIWYQHNDDRRTELDEGQVAIRYCRDKEWQRLRVSFELDPVDPSSLPDCAESAGVTPCRTSGTTSVGEICQDAGKDWESIDLHLANLLYEQCVERVVNT